VHHKCLNEGCYEKRFDELSPLCVLEVPRTEDILPDDKNNENTSDTLGRMNQTELKLYLQMDLFLHCRIRSSLRLLGIDLLHFLNRIFEMLKFSRQDS